MNTNTLNTIPLFYPINLPSELKLTECVEALDFERLLLALDEEWDDLYLKRLASLLCLVWRLEDLERDLYCLRREYLSGEADRLKEREWAL